VLDLCAGTGVVTSLLASKVGGKGSVTAIEKHDEPLERARKNNAGNSNVTLLRGNVDVYAGPHKEGGHFKGGLLEIITACEPLPKEAMGRKYDHVTLFDAISYLSPVTEMIALPVVVSSMLKPGGRFTYSTLLGKGEKETQRVWDALRHAGLDHERTVRKGANHFYVFKRASDEEAQKRLEKRYAA
jgi:SAM-dependent methyltransferase